MLLGQLPFGASEVFCVKVTSCLGPRGDEWINDATRLAGLRNFADDKEFQGKWRAIKLENKKRLAAKIKARPLLPGCLVLGATSRKSHSLVDWECVMQQSLLHKTDTLAFARF